jgi:hypothetical protein
MLDEASRFFIVLLVGAGGQLLDGTLGMGFGVFSASVLLAAGFPSTTPLLDSLWLVSLPRVLPAALISGYRASPPEFLNAISGAYDPFATSGVILIGRGKPITP